MGLVRVIAVGVCVAMAALGAVGAVHAQQDLELRYELVPGGLPQGMEATEPETAEPEAVEPAAVEPGPVELDMAEPEAAEPEVVEPAVAEPENIEPEPMESEVAEPPASQPMDNASVVQDQELRLDITNPPAASQASISDDYQDDINSEPGSEDIDIEESGPEPEPEPLLVRPDVLPMMPPLPVDTARAESSLHVELGAGLAPLPAPEPLSFAPAEQAGTVQVAAVALPEVVMPAAYTRREVEHFLFAALFSRDEQYAQEHGSGLEVHPKVVTRWEKDILVRVDGQPTDSQAAMISETVAQLDQVLAPLGTVRLALTQGEADLVVRVLDSPASGGIDGYTSKRYHQGDVIIGCDLILYGQGLSRATVQREFLHALGFMGYDPEGGATVLAPPDQRLPESAALPDMDRKALEMLYRADMRAGMDFDAALSLLAQDMAE